MQHAQDANVSSGCFTNKLGSAPPPPCFRYTDDRNGLDREIFVTPQQYWDVVKLYDNQEWDQLSKYPPYSDRPPLPPRMANVFSYTNAHGVTKELWIKPGDETGGRRAYDLYVAKQWEALETQFEPYTGQKYGTEEEEAEYTRGVERCRKAREEAAAALDNVSAP